MNDSLNKFVKKTIDIEKLTYNKISELTSRTVDKRYSLKKVLSLFK